MPIFCVDMTEKQVSYVETGLRKNLTEFFERLSDVTEIAPDWLEQKLGDTFRVKKVHNMPGVIKDAVRRIRRNANQSMLCMIHPVEQSASGRFWEMTN